MDPIEETYLVSHAEAAKVLRKGVIRRSGSRKCSTTFPDPIDTERYGDEIAKRGLSMWQLIDRMGGSP
jgi:hypothetical protein